MNLTIPADFPVERVKKALASEGLAIRAEIKHGETRHVLTESSQATVDRNGVSPTDPAGGVPATNIRDTDGRIAPSIAWADGSDRVAHETGVVQREPMDQVCGICGGHHFGRCVYGCDLDYNYNDIWRGDGS